MHGCCHVCFPKSCCDGKHALLVLSVGGVSKFDPDHVSEVRGQAPCGHITGRCLGHLQDQTAGTVCVGFLTLSPRTVPNVSAYRPDYLFQTVIGVLGGHPSRSC